MVIKLKSKKPIQAPQSPPPSHRFTLQQLDELFKEVRENWDKFYKKNETKFWKNNLDVYEWIVYPCITKDEHFYRCVIHDTVNVDAGDKHYKFPYKNINFSELLSHCVFYAPEEHKQYIIEKLKLNVDTATTTKSDDKKEKI